MNKLQLIGFTGKIRAGKSESAHYLKVKHGYSLVSFAYPLKKSVSILLDTNVMDMNQEEKDVPIKKFGISPREMMQKMATDFIRNTMDKDFFIKHLDSRIQFLLNVPKKEKVKKIVIDDVRFENEAKYIKSKGGTIVHLSRGEEQWGNHESEYGLLDEDIKYFIENNKKLNDLYWNLDMLSMCKDHSMLSIKNAPPIDDDVKQWALSCL